MKFEKGDRVRIINIGEAGTLLRIRKYTAIVLLDRSGLRKVEVQYLEKLPEISAEEKAEWADIWNKNST